MFARLFRTTVFALTLVSAAHAQEITAANAVTHWNTIATDTFAPSEGTNPMAQSRTLAIFHAAIHDALNAIDRRYESYTPGLAPTPDASVDAAVASAARDVLVALVPDRTAFVDAAYVQALANVPDGTRKTGSPMTFRPGSENRERSSSPIAGSTRCFGDLF